MFPETPVILKSTNYDLFRKIDFNRSIDKGNFKKLLVENRKNFQLHRFPILVNAKMEIIDGQHRYEVSKEIGAPVYYIKEPSIGSDFESIHSVNKAGKKHNLKDKIEMMFRAGDESATMIVRAFRLYNGTFDLGVIATLLTTGSDNGHTLKKVDSDTGLALKNYTNGIEVLDALFNSQVPSKGKGYVVKAVSALSLGNGVHPKAICKRVEINMNKWITPKSRHDAINSFIRCYNYNLEAKNRIKSDY